MAMRALLAVSVAVCLCAAAAGERLPLTVATADGNVRGEPSLIPSLPPLLCCWPTGNGGDGGRW